MHEDRTSFERWATPGAGGPTPPSDLTISEAKEQDVAGCVALAGVVSNGPADEWAALFRHNIRQSDRYLVVARTSGDVIAYGRTAWFEPDADAPANAAPAGYYLIGLVVDPRWRRRGIASALVEARLDWIAQRASEAWYFADAGNEVSTWLHERAGFETVSDDFWFPTVTDGGGSHLLGRVQLPWGGGSL